MTTEQKIKQAEKRIEELQLLIRHWKKQLKEVEGDGSGFTVIKPNWNGGIK